jgi:hypothetical protein
MGCRLADLRKELLGELLDLLGYTMLLHEVVMELVEFLTNKSRV